MNEQSIQDAIKSISLGDTENAKSILSKIIERDPDNLWAWVFIFKLATSREETKSVLENILRIDPGSEFALTEMARITAPETSKTDEPIIANQNHQKKEELFQRESSGLKQRLADKKLEFKRRGIDDPYEYVHNKERFPTKDYSDRTQLVNCKICKKEVSSNAPTCPHCGETLPGIDIRCPACGSSKVTLKEKGFSLGKAAIGGILLGPFGLIGGFLGMNDLTFSCIKCNYSWRPNPQDYL